MKHARTAALQGEAMNALEIRGLKKQFDGVRAVDNLTFEVGEGEIFGMLGPNGAGKTTTIRIIVDIFKQDEGTVSVLGQPPGRSQSRIGYMPEERGLYRNLSVGGMTRYLAELKGMPRAEAENSTSKWLERVDLQDWSRRKVKDLSRGMQQKLQFAVTVVHNPKLVILDEPFQGLDPVNVELVKNLIRSLRDEGASVMLSSHQMNLVEALCDRIILIDHGQSILYGVLADIKKRFASNTVLVRTAGPLPALPLAEKIEDRDGAHFITLRGGSTPQDLFRALAERGAAVELFEVASMPLDQIFISAVGGGHDA
jgi:ABC-2 type transport system ATP-binding protein